jgi:hypothetical protein
MTRRKLRSTMLSAAPSHCMKQRSAWVLEQHPLAHRQAREDVACRVRRCLCHAPHVEREAHASAFAGDRYEVVVSAVIATGAGCIKSKGLGEACVKLVMSADKDAVRDLSMLED